MKTDWDKNIPLIGGGMILGSIIFGLLLIISNDIGIFEWAYRHQALAAGMLGVLAAAVTAFLLTWQIQQNYYFNKNARERRLIAAKSVLPLVLSEFTKYGKKCVQLSLEMCTGKVIESKVPTLESAHIEIIKECIEQEDFDQQLQLTKFLRLYQIQRARLNDAIENYSSWSDEKLEENRNSQNLIADSETFGNGGYLYSSAELLLSVERLWEISGPGPKLKTTEKKSERIESLFIFQTNHSPENWPLFIGHFKNTIDNDEN